MSALLAWYPGDRAIEFFLVASLGGFVLSALALVAAWRLRKQPAARHLVLLAALCGSLAVPVLAATVSAAGFALISIRLLPTMPREPNTLPTPARLTPEPVTGQLAVHDLSGTTDPRAASTDLARLGDHPLRNDSLQSRTALAQAVASVSPNAGSPRGRELDPAGRFSTFRAIATLALSAWCCVTALLLVRLARSWRLVHRLRRSAAPVSDVTVLRLLDEVARALGTQLRAQSLVSRSVPTPLALGYRRPAIVLPAALIGAVSDEEMRDVLLHETAHLIRRDPLIVLLQELARALYWPIVSVHPLIRELARAREELCDNHVLQGRDALSYGETLLHLAALSQGPRPPVAAVGILPWKGELERRIAGLLDQGRSTMTRNNRWLVCLVALLFGAAGFIASATRLSAEGRQTTVGTPNADKSKDANATPATSAKAEKQQNRSMLIHVVGPDGHPMAGVKILRSVWTRKPGARDNQNQVTNDRGEVRFKIPDSIYIVRLWARYKGHVPLFAHWEEEDNPEKTLPAEFTFRLRPGTTIGGVVKDSAGQPIEGVMVEVQLERGGKREGRTGPDTWLAARDAPLRQVTLPITDEQGRWALDNVPPENDLELRLKLRHPHYISDPEWGSMQEKQGVDLKALRARTATITMEGGIVATGSVTDPLGKPVAGAVVVRGERPYWETGSQEVRTDEQGRYRLPPLPRGELKITVVAQGWMPALKKIKIEPGLKPVDFRLEPGKELRVRFVDRDGKPVPSVYVSIDKWRGGESLYNVQHPNVLATKIPLHADAAGLYRWTWAPADVVSYRCSTGGGYAELKIDLIADGREHTVTLPKVARISGKVTDQAGRPIKGVIAIPVLVFRNGGLFAEHNRANGPFDGTYKIEGDRTDVSYRVRIEAPGYRSAMSDAAKTADPDRAFDFHLVTAPPAEGRVVDSAGQPLRDVNVFLATHSQNLNDWPAERGMIPGAQKVVTDNQGRFTFPAQFERYAVVSVDDRGYAEAHRDFREQPGDLVLKPWARVEGRLLHLGQPIPGVWISFIPVRLLNDTSPHIQDSFSIKTDRDGRFLFPRVPPVKAHVQAQLSVWGDYPFTSSQSVPLDLQPGQTVHLTLGGEGTNVKGRVVFSGDAASKIDLHKSLNWLLSRAPGIEPPPEVRATGLTATHGWNNAWTSTREGLALIETLHTHFVVLDADGRFQISGVPAGDYDLALRLYEPPGDGCLVSPVGSRIVRFQITEQAARAAGFDLGEIPVTVAIGPRVGDLAPDFTAVPFSGGTITLSGMRGRYVLLDFWATWCGPCVANLPSVNQLYETVKADPRVAIVGLNLDDDQAQAKSFFDARKLPWTQAYIGGRAAADDILARYAVSFIPTYILIGPDGKLMYRGDQLAEIAKILKRELH